MTAIARARTARKPHNCENCHWHATRRGVATIAPGHRYVLHTAFPDEDGLEISKPYSLKECVACYAERSGNDPFTVEACGTYCHGDVPCARPFRHDGDHGCRRCAEEAP